MTGAVRSRIWTTISIVLIAAGFCVFSYRWYTGSPIANTIETVHVGGGSSIAIRNLTGYCNDIDPDVISSLERAASNGKIIAVSAPCRDLAALKSGRVAGLRKYIVWFVGSTDSGSPLKLPADTTQSDFANEIANTTAKVDFAEVASDVAKNGLKVGIIRQGLVDREVDAVYLGSILAGDDGGTVKIIPCVTGIAAIHHFVVTINAYDEFKGSATFSELLASVKSLMHAALSDNSENQRDAGLNHESSV